MDYTDEQIELLDNGQCPMCGSDLAKASHSGGMHDDKSSVCTNKKCGWVDDEY